MELILKVQKSYDNYRLEFTKQDSINIIKLRGAPINLTIPPCRNLTLKSSCGPPNNKGFDLQCKEINQWILSNNFHDYPKGKPTKLIFDYNLMQQVHFLTFIKSLTQ
ncbi:MAG: hypothetical protein ORN85_10095 [Sediminibacterium sp.]|nr:hypothetical protein [Sediminibacterium sp.]